MISNGEAWRKNSVWNAWPFIYQCLNFFWRITFHAICQRICINAKKLWINTIIGKCENVLEYLLWQTVLLEDDCVVLCINDKVQLITIFPRLTKFPRKPRWLAPSPVGIRQLRLPLVAQFQEEEYLEYEVTEWLHCSRQTRQLQSRLILFHQACRALVVIQTHQDLQL